MKTIANRIFQYAAGAALLTASAFAQSNMTANIPFAFHANGATMPAGTYHVDASTTPSGSRFIVLRSRSTNPVIAVAGSLDAPSANRGARLVFHCKDNGCDLRQVWTNDAGYSYPGHAKESADDRVASIPLTNAKAD
ncbi:MAG TPA: hypothetical protein VKB79_19985 [Bryobacteraceae bacterium]|nr:hypothetical protein [Bryobacteraceae bacterium]